MRKEINILCVSRRRWPRKRGKR